MAANPEEAIARAVRASELRASDLAISALLSALDEFTWSNMRERLAHLIGQCGHESAGFTRLVESLFYTTPERLCAVWPGRFRTISDARPFVRSPQALANNVYNGRMGNRPGSDDGWRYRGRGYLQLTGRDNYRRFGDLLGLPLEARPEMAEGPITAWRIAIAYLATRKRRSRTAFEWADLGLDGVEMVTRIVNGGTHGLDDRRRRTAAALAALEDPDDGDLGPGLHGFGVPPTVKIGDEGIWVEAAQRALVRLDCLPGAIDGDFGPRTEGAVRDFQRGRDRVAVDGIVGPQTWQAIMAAQAHRWHGGVAA